MGRAGDGEAKLRKARCGCARCASGYQLRRGARTDDGHAEERERTIVSVGGNRVLVRRQTACTSTVPGSVQMNGPGRQSRCFTARAAVNAVITDGPPSKTWSPPPTSAGLSGAGRSRRHRGQGANNELKSYGFKDENGNDVRMSFQPREGRLAARRSRWAATGCGAPSSPDTGRRPHRRRHRRDPTGHAPPNPPLRCRRGRRHRRASCRHPRASPAGGCSRMALLTAAASAPPEIFFR